jgi:hypothetical protein
MAPTMNQQQNRKKTRQIWKLLFVGLFSIQLYLLNILHQFDTRRQDLKDAKDNLKAVVQGVLERQRSIKESTSHLKSSLQHHLAKATKSSVLPEWMNQYLTWHSEQVAKMNRDNWQDFKYIIMQCVREDPHCGGASDRLKPLPMMLLIANQTRRIFLIWWTMPCPLEEFLVPNQINWTVPEWMPLSDYSINGQLTTKTEGLVAYARHEEQTIVRSRLQAWDGGRVYFEEQAPPTMYDSIYHDVWRILFNPAPPIATILHDEMDGAGIAPGEYAVAHYRALYARASRDETDIAKTAINAANCASQLRPGGPVYFASDSTVALRSVQDYAKNHGYPIVTIENQVPLHLDKAGNWSTRHPSDFYSVFVDLYLMGMGKCVSYGQGGFGRYGLLLSYNASCYVRHTVKGRKKNCSWITP